MYLSSIIKSGLSWIEDDDEKEKIWSEASRRMTERCGRTAMGEITRRWPFREEDLTPTFELIIREPPLTGDSLGLKTWGSSYVLAKHLPSIGSTALFRLFDESLGEPRPSVLELGSGTGLLGIAAAALWKAHVLLSDLPDIMSNLWHNVEANRATVEKLGGSLDAGALTWGGSGNDEVDQTLFLKRNQFKLSIEDDARAVVMVPLRDETTKKLLKTFRDAMGSQGRPLNCIEEGTLDGQDDWGEDEEGTQTTVKVRLTSTSIPTYYPSRRVPSSRGCLPRENFLPPSANICGSESLPLQVRPVAPAAIYVMNHLLIAPSSSASAPLPNHLSLADSLTNRTQPQPTTSNASEFSPNTAQKRMTVEMVGQITYTEEQIIFILQQSLAGEKPKEILDQYEEQFSKPLTMAQLKYIKVKYGHDPEFGTAMINGKVPDNGGNRKTAAQSPQQEAWDTPAQCSNNQSDQSWKSSTDQPQSNSDRRYSMRENLQSMENYTHGSPTDIRMNLASSSGQAQHQQQQDEVPQDQQALFSAEEYSAAHNRILELFQMNPDRPYGEQPVQQHYERMFQPSKVQKRKWDGLAEVKQGSGSFLPTRETLAVPAAVDEEHRESTTKRQKIQLRDSLSQKTSLKYSPQIPNTNTTHQALRQDDQSLSLLDLVIPEIPSPHTNQETGAGDLQAAKDSSVSPLTKLLNSIDNEYGLTNDSSFPSEFEHQMSPVGNNAVYFDNTMCQGSDLMAVPMRTETGSTMPSASPSINFSQSMSNAQLEAPNNDAEYNFWGSSLDGFQGTTAHDSALERDFDSAFLTYPQTFASDAYAELPSNVGRGHEEGLGDFSGMRSQQQSDGQNVASFSGDISNVDLDDINNFGWGQIDLSSAEPPQSHDGHFQEFLGPLE
ncbi:hypothetical protein CORC01_07209 [Colletotrichum orchidophilum]|uniref:Protein-lysine N-methyltransferase EFM2 n=1 Tax=Colletotrichum orchidophilum TaxID=1209926 RepID=A0A1G4B7N3_9PEZI|nr:uncharacterized protein CORC01_07209 [Colletotrichum orchidophilum]OHE97427.1 hypothetical protein CORC01_07209 [Colletotrichum orchidophilum]